MSVTSMLTRIVDRFSLAGPLRAVDRPRWAGAETLPQLAELTAQWLEGRIASQPGYYGPVDVDEDEAPGLTTALILLNRAGYLTNSSQAGYTGPDYDGRPCEQLAAVTGFAEQDTVDRLTDALAGTPYRMLAWPCATGWTGRGRGVAVTTIAGRAVTTFGQQCGRGVIAGELYSGCDLDAIDAVCAALQVTVWDPVPGRNELWPFLTTTCAGLR